MYRTVVRSAVLGLAALLAGCFIDVRSPDPGKPLAVPAGRTLVFGRVQVLSDAGREYRPWDPADLVSPELHLMLLRLGPREVAPGMPFRQDGRFHWWLAPGDYALLGNRHDVFATRTTDVERQDMTVLALLRVPAGAAASYAGDLRITAVDVDVHGNLSVHFDFGGTRVEDRRDEARTAFRQLFGTPATTPVVTLMCAGEAVPGFNDPQLFARARSLLDAGCHAD